MSENNEKQKKTQPKPKITSQKPSFIQPTVQNTNILNREKLDANFSPYIYMCGWERMWGKWSVPWGVLQWQCSPISVLCGWGGLPWPSPPCGSDFHSRIQEAVMTSTRTETISLSLNRLFHCRLTQQLCRLRKSRVSKVTLCPPIISLQLQEFFIIPEIKVWVLLFRLQVVCNVAGF